MSVRKRLYKQFNLLASRNLLNKACPFLALQSLIARVKEVKVSFSAGKYHFRYHRTMAIGSVTVAAIVTTQVFRALASFAMPQMEH